METQTDLSAKVRKSAERLADCAADPRSALVDIIRTIADLRNLTEVILDDYEFDNVGLEALDHMEAAVGILAAIAENI